MIERRSIERFPLAVNANISGVVEGDGEVALECTASDICAGGGYFPTEAPLPVDTSVKVDIYWPPKDAQVNELYAKSRIRITGCVVRSERRGMAIGFTGDAIFLKVQ